MTIGEAEYPDPSVSEDLFTITAIPLGDMHVAILFKNASEQQRLQKELLEQTEESARLAMLNETALTLAHHVRNALTPINLLAGIYDGSDLEVAAQLKKITIQQGNRIAAIIGCPSRHVEPG